MRSLRPTIAAGLLAAAPLCFGQQITAPFTASASVVRGCAIVIPDLAFGTYQADAAAAEVLAVTSVTVACGVGDTFTIGMGDGANISGQQRRMARTAGAVAYLNYNLYRDAARTLVWRDTGQTRLSGTGTGGPQQFPVYGQVPGAQVVPAGPYVDTVTVTVRN